ncbi:TPA: pyridoxal phosphate-dependent aminotransferase [Staphylococcus pseudintermedius]|nr:pyridoxal phosphate-dependent aminotransferase [Staphylococcus pseudintermedius]
MGGTEQQYIERAFEQNWIAPLGGNVNAFEDSIKSYVGSDYALALSSGTAAVHLALIESGVEAGDVVFCSTLTFCATSNPILYQNATPVFIDSEKDSWNMSPIALKKAFKAYEDKGIKPRAVIVVNLYGQMSGTFGDYSIFSFNGNKIITTSGGGMLVSTQHSLDHALFLSTQARDQALHYEHSELGYNYRLSNISAGIGRGQMEVLNERIARRRAIFENYHGALHDFKGFEFQPELKSSQGNRWLTALTINPDEAGITVHQILEKLSEANIEARPVWKPMHLQPLYRDYDYIPESSDNAKTLFENGICLPSGSDMTDEQQDRIISIIKMMYEAAN